MHRSQAVQTSHLLESLDAIRKQLTAAALVLSFVSVGGSTQHVVLQEVDCSQTEIDSANAALQPGLFGSCTGRRCHWQWQIRQTRHHQHMMQYQTIVLATVVVEFGEQQQQYSIT